MENLSQRISQRFSLQFKSLPFLAGFPGTQSASPEAPGETVSRRPKTSDPSRYPSKQCSGRTPRNSLNLQVPMENDSVVRDAEESSPSASPAVVRRHSLVESLPDISLSAPDEHHLPATPISASNGTPSPVAPPRRRDSSQRDADKEVEPEKENGREQRSVTPPSASTKVSPTPSFTPSDNPSFPSGPMLPRILPNPKEDGSPVIASASSGSLSTTNGDGSMQALPQRPTTLVDTDSTLTESITTVTSVPYQTNTPSPNQALTRKPTSVSLASTPSTSREGSVERSFSPFPLSFSNSSNGSALLSTPISGETAGSNTNDKISLASDSGSLEEAVVKITKNVSSASFHSATTGSGGSNSTNGSGNGNVRNSTQLNVPLSTSSSFIVGFSAAMSSPSVTAQGSSDSSAGKEKDKERKGNASLLPSAGVVRHNSDASSVASSTGKSAKSNDKKRQRWYQSLYPTYKQRSEEFRKLFPSVPKTERLLVDYSCALQRDILVQGRLYVSQNHICFYAKIIAWETNICTPWKQVTGLSKERTAKIIPNAISYCTDNDHYYFTSFGQRDKTFTNLYRIWQGAAKDQPMSVAEMWSFIHYQYGDELGLTSDDEDYVQPAYLRSLPALMVAVNAAADAADADADDEDHQDPTFRSTNQILSSVSLSTQDLSGIVPQERDRDGDAQSGQLQKSPSRIDSGGDNARNKTERRGSVSSSSGSGSSSSTSDGQVEDDTQPLFIPPPPTGGQTFIDHEFHIPFDQLFLVLFSESSLLKEMYLRRKFYHTKFGQWILDPTTDCQVRDVKYCITIGPKTIRTEERQTLLKESVPGRLHLVDSVAQNHGAPYSDSFSVVTHYMVLKADGKSGSSRLRVVTEVVFRKANWAVKALLEKGVMDQLRDYMADLKSRLSTFEAELATAPHDDDDEESNLINVESSGMILTRGKSGSIRDRDVAVSGSGPTGTVPLPLISAVTSGTFRSTLRRSYQTSGGQIGDEDSSVQFGLTQNQPSIFVTQTEYGKAKKLVYILLGLLVLNAVLYWKVWLHDHDQVIGLPSMRNTDDELQQTKDETLFLKQEKDPAWLSKLRSDLKSDKEGGWKKLQWLDLISLLDEGSHEGVFGDGQAKDADTETRVLNTVTDGLTTVLAGLEKISGALEQVQKQMISRQHKKEEPASLDQTAVPV